MFTSLIVLLTELSPQQRACKPLTISVHPAVVGCQRTTSTGHFACRTTAEALEPKR